METETGTTWQQQHDQRTALLTISVFHAKSAVMENIKLKRGAVREDKPGMRFWSYQKQGGKVYECWLREDSFNRSKEKTAEWARNYHQTEEGRQARLRSNAKYRSTEEGKVATREATKKWIESNIEACRFHRKRAQSHAAGIPFNLTIEDFANIPDVCPALGIPLLKTLNKGKPADNSPSLDRIDPQLGYTKGNVVWVSNLANRIKTNATPEQLMKVATFYASLQPDSPFDYEPFEVVVARMKKQQAE